MATTLSFLDEDEQLSPTEVRYARTCGTVDEALSADTRQGRYASLLATFLVSEPQEREALFVETARRLSRCDAAATGPSSPSCPEENPPVSIAPGRIEYRPPQRRSVLDWVAAAFRRVRS
ncbi:hypothetical protein R1A27_04775 [Methylobacterium sp. NMS12]|uniref:hypothetical protein n=1 Tax=Methylobacterium sp. NMS12 TaxID=3079766 RepID=UPI003F881609